MLEKRNSLIVDYSKDKEFLCMLNDAKLIYNLLDQKTRPGLRSDDFIQPGLLSSQSISGIILLTMESIKNHLDNLDKDGKVLL